MSELSEAQNWVRNHVAEVEIKRSGQHGGWDVKAVVTPMGHSTYITINRRYMGHHWPHARELKSCLEPYPYTDCNDVPFRLERTGDHSWIVFVEVRDEHGAYDQEETCFDDRDTLESAVDHYLFSVESNA